MKRLLLSAKLGHQYATGFPVIAGQAMKGGQIWACQQQPLYSLPGLEAWVLVQIRLCCSIPRALSLMSWRFLFLVSWGSSAIAVNSWSLQFLAVLCKGHFNYFTVSVPPKGPVKCLTLNGSLWLIMGCVHPSKQPELAQTCGLALTSSPPHLTLSCP